MAKKTLSKSSSNGSLPKGMKVAIRTGGSIKQMEKEFASTGGPMLFPKKNEEFTIAILQTPEQWATFEEHNIQRKSGFKYVPCVGPKNCLVEKRIDGNEAKPYAMIPFYIYDQKVVKYWRAPGGAVTNLLETFKRIKANSFLGSKWIFTRDDKTDITNYDFDRLDDKVKRNIREMELPDVEKIIDDRLKRGLNDLGWLGKASLDEDQDDEDEDEYEDIDDIDDEDEEDSDDEEDELEDDDEDEEEDDEDEEELPSKRVRKPKAKKRSKK